MFTLKNHPFAVAAHFKSSMVLTFAVPKAIIEPLIPARLTLDTYNNEWAFIAVAMVQTEQLRPKGFPSFMGNDFFLIGYRIFVQYTSKAGKRLRGLYILKSETDSSLMNFLGNIFTHYQYTKIDISIINNGVDKRITSQKGNFSVTMDTAVTDNTIELPKNSPFPNWKTARRYAGPLPFTFTFLPKTNQLLIVEGVREDWIPQPITIKDYHFSFLNKLNIGNPILANAFEIKNIPYYWKKGRLEK